MASNKFTPVERGQPLPVAQLKAGQYYEDILTEQRVLIVRIEEETIPMHKNSDGNEKMIEVLARYHNRVTGQFEDFWVANNQLREFK